MTKPQEFWVYILLCSNGCYYTGYTSDLERRYQEHLEGSAKSKYTRSFKPVKLAQSWKIEGGRGDAMKLESYIKSLNRAEKERLIKHPELLES